ncbi:unnamed protein product [Phytophthora lilii]|uniref:Unnamed protein product n=1 Tax=Phytophthora lilii TaxID=2077276 RepID=A0A9W6TPC2_9STRA|nr:unnamed protein product [Phytophthora lilii]
MMLKLQRKGLWEYCEREVADPEASKQEAHSKWSAETRRTREYLFDAMSGRILKTVKYEPTPFRIMERMKRRFVGKLYVKLAAEVTKLSSMRFDMKGDMTDHLSEIRRVLDRVSLLEKPVDEYWKPAFLMRQSLRI